jgi:hypothetical protein
MCLAFLPAFNSLRDQLNPSTHSKVRLGYPKWLIEPLDNTAHRLSHLHSTSCVSPSIPSIRLPSPNLVTILAPFVVPLVQFLITTY